MADDFVVRGAEDFYALSKRCKQVDKEFRKELNTGLRLATKPLIADTRAAARESLPKRGGLAARVAKAPQRVQIRTGAKTAGVRIVTRTHDTAATDRGRLRHPVFGHRDRWVMQSVKPGWFSQTLEHNAPKVRPEIERAMERVARMVAGRG